MLEAFFTLNLKRQIQGDKYPVTYRTVSRYYVFNKKSGTWNKRQRLSVGATGYVVNRIDSVSVME